MKYSLNTLDGLEVKRESKEKIPSTCSQADCRVPGGAGGCRGWLEWKLLGGTDVVGKD